MSLKVKCPNCGEGLDISVKLGDFNKSASIIYPLRKTGQNLGIYISKEIERRLNLHYNEFVEVTIKKVD